MSVTHSLSHTVSECHSLTVAHSVSASAVTLTVSECHCPDVITVMTDMDDEMSDETGATTKIYRKHVFHLL